MGCGAVMPPAGSVSGLGVYRGVVLLWPTYPERVNIVWN
jgi:hypothetical protein